MRRADTHREQRYDVASSGAPQSLLPLQCSACAIHTCHATGTHPAIPHCRIPATIASSKLPPPQRGTSALLCPLSATIPSPRCAHCTPRCDAALNVIPTPVTPVQPLRTCYPPCQPHSLSQHALSAHPIPAFPMRTSSISCAPVRDVVTGTTAWYTRLYALLSQLQAGRVERTDQVKHKCSSFSAQHMATAWYKRLYALLSRL